MLKMALIILVTVNFSCEKFVDVKKNSSQSLIETPNDCQLLLNDYANMNVGYPSDGEVSCDDYYLSDDGYLSSSIVDEDRQIYTWQQAAIRSAASPQWQFPYKVVYLSNLVIEAVDNLQGTGDQHILDDLRGQALFFRAYSFWQLAQLYAPPYTNATQSPGIPLRLNSDINGKSNRGTLNETYAQIINDLKEATNLLSTNFLVASRPNKTAAFALLARVYLSTNNYASSLENATSALQINNNLIDFNTLDPNSETPFSRFNKEVVFHSLMSPSMVLTPGSASDNIAKIDLTLVSSYLTNDLRRQIYFKANSSIHIGTYRFTGNYEPVTSSLLFNGIAVDELYLIRSECYARIGNISSAMEDLNRLLLSRWKTGTYVPITASSTNDALNKILIERRKELVMRGQRWTDLRRLNNEELYAKTLSRTVNGVTYNLPPNDPRYTLLIPDEVIRNSQIAQNVR